MIVEIIAIGTEVTTGSIVNTNSTFLSKELLELGMDVYYHTSVDDHPERLKQVVEIAINRADIIFTTGGLGPTKDDMTKEVIAEILNKKLILDSEVEEWLINRFKGKGNMPSNNLRQAMKPEGTEFIPNSMGTAPGVHIKEDKFELFMLPGPPKEMKNMFLTEIKPILKDKNSIVTESINIFGLGESTIEMEIEDLLDKYEDVYVATFAHGNQVEVKLIGKGNDVEKLKLELKDIISIVTERLKENVYGYGNVSIEEVVIDLLKEKQLKVGFCESCTGGLLSSKITKISGSSAVFDRSIITYSNDAKMEEVGVLNESLDEFGPVSEQVAKEMAMGLLKHNIDIAVSVTGIAGPNSDATNKPVGLVYICVTDGENTKTIELNSGGDREAIQRRSANNALFELYKFLKMNY